MDKGVGDVRRTVSAIGAFATFLGVFFASSANAQFTILSERLVTPVQLSGSTYCIANDDYATLIPAGTDLMQVHGIWITGPYSPSATATIWYGISADSGSGVGPASQSCAGNYNFDMAPVFAAGSETVLEVCVGTGSWTSETSVYNCLYASFLNGSPQQKPPPCTVGSGTAASCTEAALDDCLPGGADFTGLVRFNCGSAATIPVTATKTIDSNTIVEGDGAVTVSGGDAVRVFFVVDDVELTLDGIDVVNGYSWGQSEGQFINGGGAIYTEGGDLKIENCTFISNHGPGSGGAIYSESGDLKVNTSQFVGNTANILGGALFKGAQGEFDIANTEFTQNHAGDAGSGAGGGAIFSYGAFNIRECSFSLNSTGYDGSGPGGAIYTYGNGSVLRSTFRGNSAGSSGGAIHNYSNYDSPLTVANCTFFENHAYQRGGAIDAYQGAVNVLSSSFSGNTAGSGGAIGVNGATVSITNSIIEDSSGGNCGKDQGFQGSLVDAGLNIEDAGTCGFAGAGCLFPIGASRCNTDPQMDPTGPADNGGPTETIALCSGPGAPSAGCVQASPAIAAGEASSCASYPVSGLDQRGYLRPSHCSIGAYELNSVPAPAPITYAALGDSYSSGEGALSYLEGTEIGGTGNGCHRSAHAYPRRIEAPGRAGKTLFDLSATPYSSHSLAFVACSGAKSSDVTPVSPPIASEEEALEPVQVFSDRVDVNSDLVTVTFGGNDIGFATVLTSCVDETDCQDKPLFPEVFGPYATLDAWIRGRISSKVPEWTRRFEAIKSRFQSASIFVFGYPRLVSGEPCFATRKFAVSYGLAGELDADEQASIRDWANALNAGIFQAAKAAGVHYVPVAEYFAGHEVCSFDQDWITGISESAFLLNGCRECFHPKQQGQRAYATAFSDYIKLLRDGNWGPGFTAAGLPRNPVGTSLVESLLTVDEEPLGRLGDLEVLPAARGDCGDLTALSAGTGVHLSGEGFDGSSPVAIRVSVSGDEVVVDSSQSDESGRVSSEVVLPGNLPSGRIVQFRVSGIAADGSPLVLLGSRLAIAPEFASVDSDADGISDDCDLCPDLFSEQLDSDADGVGNECDQCPWDPENDFDEDNECSDEDLCPLDAHDDEDGDGLCSDVDRCPWVFDPAQEDLNINGDNDACSAICGSPVKHAPQPVSSDCLHILRSAVSLGGCTLPCICDTNADKSIKAGDALQCLRRAVGAVQALACGC